MFNFCIIKKYPFVSPVQLYESISVQFTNNMFVVATTTFKAQAGAQGPHTYKTAGVEWTDEEQALLNQALVLYPAGIYSPASRYIKIAASIRTKCVRDVTRRMHWMNAVCIHILL